MEYITPTKLRNSALGTVIGNRTDAQLLSLIRVASGLANRQCAAPRVYDFRGGTVVNEQHPWDIGNDHVAGSRRVYPYHPPIKTINRFQIRVTQGGAGVIDFPTSQIYINALEQYVELVSLSLTTASVYAAGLIPNIGLATPVAELDYEYGSTFLITDERLSTVSGDKLFFTEGQFWTTDAPVVKVAGNIVGTGFSYDPYEGRILFTNPVAPGAEVTISYSHKLHPNISEATALIAADVVAQTRLNAAGLQGLSGLRVLEVEMRQSRTAGFAQIPVSPAAAMLLEPFRFRSFA